MTALEDPAMLSAEQPPPGNLRPELARAAFHASRFLAGLADRPVTAQVEPSDLRQALGLHLPDTTQDPAAVIDALVAAAEPGLVASSGGRYFGYVTGGSLPVATAADWLVAAWDQNAAFYPMSPAASVIEEVTGRWISELLGIPASASFGFTTGTQSAHLVALAAARNGVLERSGWDVRTKGLAGSPPITVIAGADRHVTIDRAVRLLGLGTDSILAVASDDEGAMSAEAFRSAFAATTGPTIVCAQVGNVNTGAFDPVASIAEVVQDSGAWLHIDGAFGLWAAASPALRHLVAGHPAANSWAVDAHKWLNVPYDAAMVFVADPSHHLAATQVSAPYLPREDAVRDNSDWVLEFSRRARSVPTFAALRTLGRAGIVELVERSCAHAREFHDELLLRPEVEVLNDVVLNQVLWRHRGGPGATRALLAAIQSSRVTWMGPTSWRGEIAIRTSFSSWATTDADVVESVAVIAGLLTPQNGPAASARGE